MFRNVTLKCLTEIAGVSVNQYEEQFVNLFTLTMCQLKQVHTHTHDYVTQCKQFSESECVISNAGRLQALLYVPSFVAQFHFTVQDQ